MLDILDYETIREGFYAVDDVFIFPNTISDIRLFPENKRGFGGIFWASSTCAKSNYVWQ